MISPSTNDLPFIASGSPNSEEPPYLGGSRGQAVAALSHGMRDREILMLLTGSAGVGKSVVLNAALAALANGPIRVIRLCNPGGSAWTKPEVARQIMGRSVESPTDEMVSACAADLAATTEGYDQSVIALDDAQTLTEDAMEFLLLLASPARGSEKPPQLILCGRGEFWEVQKRAELDLITRFAERVSLEGFSRPDARDYISFRLNRSGVPNDVIISHDALTEIVLHSSGLPARIDRILTTAMSIRVCRGGQILTGEMVEAAIASLVPAPGEPRSVAASTSLWAAPARLSTVEVSTLVNAASTGPAGAEVSSASSSPDEFGGPTPGITHAPTPETAPGDRAPDHCGEPPVAAMRGPVPRTLGPAATPPPDQIAGASFDAAADPPVPPAVDPSAVDSGTDITSPERSVPSPPARPGRVGSAGQGNVRSAAASARDTATAVPRFRGTSGAVSPTHGGDRPSTRVAASGVAKSRLTGDVAPVRKLACRATAAAAIVIVLVLGGIASRSPEPGRRVAGAIGWPWSPGPTTPAVAPSNQASPLAEPRDGRAPDEPAPAPMSTAAAVPLNESHATSFQAGLTAEVLQASRPFGSVATGAPSAMDAADAVPLSFPAAGSTEAAGFAETTASGVPGAVAVGDAAPTPDWRSAVRGPNAETLVPPPPSMSATAGTAALAKADPPVAAPIERTMAPTAKIGAIVEPGPAIGETRPKTEEAKPALMGSKAASAEPRPGTRGTDATIAETKPAPKETRTASAEAKPAIGGAEARGTEIKPTPKVTRTLVPAIGGTEATGVQTRPTATEAKTASAEPKPTIGGTEATGVETRPAPAETQAVSAEPNPTISEAETTGTKTRPSPAETKTASTEPKPAINVAETTGTKTRPSPAQTKTASAIPKPAISGSEATGAETWPAATEATTASVEPKPMIGGMEATGVETRPAATKAKMAPAEPNPAIGGSEATDANTRPAPAEMKTASVEPRLAIGGPEMTGAEINRAPAETKTAPAEPKPAIGGTGTAGAETKSAPAETKTASAEPKPAIGVADATDTAMKPTPKETMAASTEPNPMIGGARAGTTGAEPANRDSETAFSRKAEPISPAGAEPPPAGTNQNEKSSSVQQTSSPEAVPPRATTTGTAPASPSTGQPADASNSGTRLAAALPVATSVQTDGRAPAGPPDGAPVREEATSGGSAPELPFVPSHPQPPPASAAARPLALALAPPQMVSSLLRRGEAMLQLGDVLSARLFFERAAAAGSGEGAVAAGKTFDPEFLATLDAPGLKGDVTRAIEWYRMASTVFGDQRADARLKALTAQSAR